jgi:hypothetical protein
MEGGGMGAIGFPNDEWIEQDWSSQVDIGMGEQPAGNVY